ncbi:hypothetical protein H9638_14830 [Arthrobacter sp. Sa2BUA2]|uniref:Uncharacterized protein n=1 Tax=Arthrobacter pullicola TaxID=2762224 RepID=A0ABR8YLG8_9MICC|nr:hypothetical protein [Arthrobacter pullicola]MBD8045085.1 hypothetical protein [Arthrobacter pullicola]
MLGTGTAGDTLGQEITKAGYADRSAGMWLMRAAGAGALYSLFLELSGNAGFRPPWETLDLTWIPAGPYLQLLVPAGLILGAYLMTARVETKLGIRQQRGALAVLVFAALFLPLGGVFAATYGVSLLALSVRTRETLTVVTGVMALVAWIAVSFLSSPVPGDHEPDLFSNLSGPGVLALMAATLFIAASKVNPGRWQDAVGLEAGGMAQEPGPVAGPGAGPGAGSGAGGGDWNRGGSGSGTGEGR